MGSSDYLLINDVMKDTLGFFKAGWCLDRAWHVRGFRFLFETNNYL